MQQYQQHKQQYNTLKEELEQLKTMTQSSQTSQQAQTQQQKQKKKPRPPEQDDSLSMNVNMNEPFGKSVLRHSMRSLQHPIGNTSTEHHQKVNYKTTEASSLNEDVLSSGIYGLSLNGYNNYVERFVSRSKKEINISIFISFFLGKRIHLQKIRTLNTYNIHISKDILTYIFHLKLIRHKNILLNSINTIIPLHHSMGIT